MAVQRLTAVIGRVLAAAGLLFLLVTFSPLTRWWAATLAGPTWDDPDGDILIVLGGSLLEDGAIGESSYWRSVYASTAFSHGRFRRVIISGGGDGERSVAATMGHFLECSGVPHGAIILEEESRDTRQNALMVKRLLGNSPGVKVLLTSDYHMLRASRAFKTAGLDVLPRPLPDAIKRSSAPSRRWGVFVELARETAALVYYYQRGWA